MGKIPQAKDYYRVANGFYRNALQDAKITGREFVDFIQNLWQDEAFRNTPIFGCTCEETYQAAISGAKQFFKEREEYGGVFVPKRVEVRKAWYNKYKALFKVAYKRMAESGLVELVIV